MKIISGKLKGRSIFIDKKNAFRPTLSRIREDLFNLISHNRILNIHLENSVFIDLFCGSGSIGLEALSRGAKEVIFNDIDKFKIKLIKEFLVNTELNNYELHTNDVYCYNIYHLEYANVVYVDPPYKNDLKLLEENIFKIVKKDCIVILETDQKFSPQNLIFKKEYKNKSLFFMRKTNEI